MSAVDRLADWCLRVATRRWPAALREEQLREWRAEVHEMRRQRQSWRRLRYAWSLASSPPVRDRHGWREALPGLGTALRPILALAGAALLCQLLAGLATQLGLGLLRLVRPSSAAPGGILGGAGTDRPTVVATVLSLVAATALAAAGGRWLARRAPIRWAHATRLGPTGSAVVAPLAVALGLTVAYLSAELGTLATFGWSDQDGVLFARSERLLGTALWAVLLAALAGYVVRLVHSGHRWRAGLLGLFGGLVLLDLVTIVLGLAHARFFDVSLARAPLWFPLGLFEPRDAVVPFGVAGVVVDPLLVAIGLVLGYGLAARTAEAMPAPAPAVVRVTPLATARRWVGIAVIGVALAIWAFGAAVLTGQLTPGIDEVGEFHIWAQELREAGILAAVLGLVLLLAGRGAVIVPAVLAFGALLTVDSAIDATDGGGSRVLVATLGLGVIVLSGAAWLGGALIPAPPGEAATRRTLAAVAVIAALCAPALAVHAFLADASPARLPVGFAVATTAVMALLAAMAAVAALAARRDPLPRAVAGLLIGGPVLALAAGGALTRTGGPVLGFVVVAGLPLAALLLAAARGPAASGAARRGGRVIALRVALGVGVAIAAVPLAFLQLMAAGFVGPALMVAAGYSHPADGLAYLPGALLVGLALAAASSRVALASAHSVVAGPAADAATG